MYETHTIVDSEQSLLTKMNLHFLSGHLRRHNIHLKYQNPETKPNKIPMRFTYLFRYKSPLHRLIARKGRRSGSSGVYLRFTKYNVVSFQARTQIGFTCELRTGYAQLRFSFERKLRLVRTVRDSQNRLVWSQQEQVYVCKCRPKGGRKKLDLATLRPNFEGGLGWGGASPRIYSSTFFCVNSYNFIHFCDERFKCSIKHVM